MEGKAVELWKSSHKENRDVRRKLRIARKLHELEEDVVLTHQSESRDLLELAEQHFNLHEYIPEVNLVSTLKR